MFSRSDDRLPLSAALVLLLMLLLLLMVPLVVLLDDSLKDSFPAPVTADQMCRAPVASQEAISELLLLCPVGSQHRAVIGLL